VRINPAYGCWSWVDRLNPSCTISVCLYYPSYHQVGLRVQNFTASIATAGQSGWQCPNGLNTPPYCPDDALRFGANGKYVTFDSFMKYARELHPLFLWVHQFNDFTLSDEGFDGNTNDDIEPANLWVVETCDRPASDFDIWATGWRCGLRRISVASGRAVHR
jgi:hypothetical protein